MDEFSSGYRGSDFGVARADFQRLAQENSKLRAREAKEKSQAVEYGEKAIVALSAVALGFGIGVLNAQNGATAESPYQVGASLTGTGIPIDSIAAGLGAIAILATPTSGKEGQLMPLSLGAGAGALAIWGQRTGAAWQAARAGTTTTPAAATTSAGVVGWGGGMHPRFAGHGAGSYGGYRNAYVDQAG